MYASRCKCDISHLLNPLISIWPAMFGERPAHKELQTNVLMKLVTTIQWPLRANKHRDLPFKSSIPGGKNRRIGSSICAINIWRDGGAKDRQKVDTLAAITHRCVNHSWRRIKGGMLVRDTIVGRPFLGEHCSTYWSLSTNGIPNVSAIFQLSGKKKLKK